MTPPSDDGPKQVFTTVDDYLAAATYDVEARLAEMRRIVRDALPGAEETIDHNLPAYRQHGVVVVQIAGSSEHTSLTFFPAAGVFARFAEELAPYRTTRSAVRFPLDEPLPADLLAAIARFRSEEAAAYAERRSAGR